MDPPEAEEVDIDRDALAKEFEELLEEGPPTGDDTLLDEALSRRRLLQKLTGDLLELKRGIEAAELRRLTDSTNEGYPFDEVYEVYRFMVGGMGMVLEVWNRDLRRKEALKLWLAADGNDALLREARTLARLNPHPNIVTIYGTGTWNGRRYFKMEWIDGQDGEEWLDAQPRTWREVLDLYVAAGTGLASAHADEVEHGDFKPSNILVGDDGRVCVADFGVANTMRPSEQMQLAARNGGTTSFMAPERLLGRNGDARSDQFSFCVALWVALHGVMPFRANTPAELLLAIVDQEFNQCDPRVEVPEWLRGVVRKGLHPDPEQRYASMHELLQALTNAPAADVGELADPQSEPSDDATAPAPAEVTFALLGALGGLVGTIIGLGAFLVLGSSSPTKSSLRLWSIDAIEVISAEHGQWRLGVRRFNEAKDALERGDLEVAHETWDDGRARVQRFAPVFVGAVSLGLAQMSADTKLAQSILTAAWMANGSAEAFQRAECWLLAIKAREKAAEYFRAANETESAAHQEQCAAKHRQGKICYS